MWGLRSPTPGAFISHTNPMRQPLRVSLIFRNPRGYWFARTIRTANQNEVIVLRHALLSTSTITGMAESVDNSSSEGSEGSDCDEISSSELSTSCESISVKWDWLVYMTSTVHDILYICRSLFGQSAFFCRFTRTYKVYEGHFMSCYKEGIVSRIEPLDRGMANFYRSSNIKIEHDCNIHNTEHDRNRTRW